MAAILFILWQKEMGCFYNLRLEPWKLILCHFYQGETRGLKLCSGGGPDLDSFLEVSYTPFHKWYLETTLSIFHFGVSIGSAENNVSGVGGKVVNRDWWTAISKIRAVCSPHTCQSLATEPWAWPRLGLESCCGSRLLVALESSALVPKGIEHQYSSLWVLP